MSWGCQKEKQVKLPHVPEFKNQAPRMLQKGSEALGSILVIFTSKNNKLTGRFLAWHEKLVAWEQNHYEFSINKERAVSSFERQGF
ncbi:unnamed protein product [Prunus armeniaca]